MDWKKNRLLIGGAVLVALVGLAVWATKNRELHAADPVSASAEKALPAIDKSKVDELDIHVPDKGDVTLVKKGKAWRLSKPLDAAADDSAVSSALDKLDGIEVSGIAATKASNHARLEVDDAHGIRVIAKSGGKVLADLIIGGYRSGNTMVRLHGKTEVVAVRGSIKYAFNKEVKDWRDRSVVDVSANDVKEATFDSPKGTFHFVRDGDDWKQADGETPIDKFDAAKVKSFVSSLSRLRATDFAKQGVTATQAGLDQPRATVTLVVEQAASGSDAHEDAGAAAHAAPPTRQTIVLHLGVATSSGDDFYLQRQGNPITYVISKFLADRMQPDPAKFQKSATPPPSTPPPGAGGAPSPMGMGHGKIPPQVMEQIRQQLRQRGMQAHTH